MNIYDEWCHLGCGDCEYCNSKADMDGVESQCKRIDHKHLQFAVPWFKSYDCGQLSGITCADFKPLEIRKWLYEHWVSIDDYMRAYEEIEGKPYVRGYLGLCIDKDTSVRYYVNYKDFFYNKFLNEDGSLKWVKKCYYKRSKKSPTGYELVWEYNKEVA